MMITPEELIQDEVEDALYEELRNIKNKLFKRTKGNVSKKIDKLRFEKYPDIDLDEDMAISILDDYQDQYDDIIKKIVGNFNS